MDERKKISIRDWAEGDRPREKLLAGGSALLSDAELIALLIGSGNREETAVGLARRMLGSFENSLNRLGKQSVRELMQFRGIGTAKAVAIAAALELGRRRREEHVEVRPTVSSSRDAYMIMQPMVGDIGHEEFWILLLNRSNRLIETLRTSQGGISGTVTDIRMILKNAILHSASSLVLCHNHPSGNLKPSRADMEITRKMNDAARLMDIKVLDHLIIADGSYFSFADEGILNSG
ncbi:MAG: DNA repair protein RadC [Marinilabiliales bacterium]|nr:MAG: DNA repair protein RadC [Marinilabiliales bacterium]